MPGYNNKISIFLIILIFLSDSFLLFSQEDRRWQQPQNITIMNTNEDDFAPSWNPYQNLLYFNSNISGYSQFYFTRIHQQDVSNQDSVYFDKPELVGGPINQKGNNQSYITFASSEIAYLTSFHQAESRSHLNLFATYYKKKQWTKPIIIDNLACICNTMHPAISADGSFMIFSSDRGSEEGDADLWMALKQEDGSFGGLINLSGINSSGNEITPFLAGNDTLYFASDGLGGKGGYDLFVSVRSGGIWKQPYPLWELNTEFDESDLSLLPDGSAIFASNMPGGRGKLDLYYAKSIPKTLAHSQFQSQLSLIAALTESAIKVHKGTTIETKQVIPYIYPLQILIDTNNEFHFDHASLIAAMTIRSLYVMGSRMKSNNKSDLNIFYTEPYDSNSQNIKLAESIKKYISESIKINPNRLVVAAKKMIDDNPDDPKLQPSVLLVPTDPSFYEAYLDTTKVITIEPKNLEVQIGARPAGLLKKWELYLSIDNKKTLINQGYHSQDTVYVNLDKYKESLSIDESTATLLLTGIDTIGRKVSETYPLFVERSEAKQRKFLNKDNSLVEQYFIVAKPGNINEANLSVMSIIESVAANTTDAKIINIIPINCDTKEQKAAAGKIASYIRQKLQKNSDGSIKIPVNVDCGKKKDLPIDDIPTDLQNMVWVVEVVR